MARKLTLEDAQARWDKVYPDSGMVLTRYFGNAREGCFHHPEYGDLNYAHFNNLFRLPTVEAVLKFLQAHELNRQCGDNDTLERAQRMLTRRFPDAKFRLVDYRGYDSSGVLEVGEHSTPYKYQRFYTLLAARSEEFLTTALLKPLSGQELRDYLTKSLGLGGADGMAAESAEPAVYKPLVNENRTPVTYLTDLQMLGEEPAGDALYMGLDTEILGRNRVKPESAVCVRIDDDSMGKECETVIAVDTSRTEVVGGSAYVFEQGGLKRIRILSKMPDNQALARSYNRAYRDEYLMLGDIRILGRIFWCARDF